MGNVMLFAYLLFLAVSPAPVQGANSSQRTLVGCLNRLPDGTLQLKALPSQQLYAMKGNTMPLMAHVDQIIRVVGHPESEGKKSESALTLTTNSVHVVAETCTAALPPSETEAVGGKVGEDEIAVPETTTASSAETTPGFQTEAASEQWRGGKNSPAVQSGLHTDAPYAPFKPEQVSQSEAAANANAPAAARAEILPGNTRGVSNSAPDSSVNSNRPKSK